MGSLRLVVKGEFISLRKVQEPNTKRIKVQKKTLIKIVLFAFVFAVFVPLQFSFSGLVVTLHQLILIAAFVPCIILYCITLYKKKRDWVIADITITLYSLWVSMSIVYVHGLDNQIFTIAFHIVNTLGCYLFGRMLVRDKDMFVFLMRALVFLVILSIPFAVYENLHSIRIINSYFANYGLMIDGGNSQNIGLRLGFHRAMLTFDPCNSLWRCLFNCHWRCDIHCFYQLERAYPRHCRYWDQCGYVHLFSCNSILFNSGRVVDRQACDSKNG